MILCMVYKTPTVLWVSIFGMTMSHISNLPISAVVMVIRLPFLDVYYVSRYDFLVSPTFFWVEFLIITHIHTCTQMTRTCTCICPFPSVVKVTRYPFAFDTLHEKIGFYGDYIHVHKFSLQLQLLCALFFQHNGGWNISSLVVKIPMGALVILST